MLVLEKDFDVRTNEFNMEDKFTVYGCLNYFQEVARMHATMLNLGYDKALEKNMYWVLMKTKFEFISDVMSEEKIKVVTWPSNKSKIDFTRDYEIYSNKNGLAVKGSSQWVVIDKNTRKIIKAELVEFPAIAREQNYIKNRFPKVEILPLEKYTKSYKYKITHFDMDHNIHVNNTSYARILFDGLELKDFKNIKSFEINYLHEAYYGTEIEVLYCFEDNNIIGLIKSDNILNASFKIVYNN